MPFFPGCRAAWGTLARVLGSRHHGTPGDSCPGSVAVIVVLSPDSQGFPVGNFSYSCATAFMVIIKSQRSLVPNVGSFYCCGFSFFGNWCRSPLFMNPWWDWYLPQILLYFRQQCAIFWGSHWSKCNPSVPAVVQRSAAFFRLFKSPLWTQTMHRVPYVRYN